MIAEIDAGTIQQLQAEIQRLESELAEAKEYVPMTNYEHYSLWSKLYNATMEQKNWNNNATWNNERVLEAEVVKRASLVVKEK